MGTGQDWHWAFTAAGPVSLCPVLLSSLQQQLVPTVFLHGIFRISFLEDQMCNRAQAWGKEIIFGSHFFKRKIKALDISVRVQEAT